MTTEPKPAGRPPHGSGINAILFFVFGTAAGIFMAYAGFGYLQDSAALIATVFLSALVVILLLGVLIFATRRILWQRIFGYAEVQIESFATPLSQVAERAIAGDPTGATAAARDLVALALARYSWISTRRWIIAALTGLIAAMAALAGTALLFKQNQLIEAQTALLSQQNDRIADQSLLMEQQVELAEADRNAQLAVQITEIAATLGKLLDDIDSREGVTGKRPEDIFNAIGSEDLTRELILRITSISRAVKPYRFLDFGAAAPSQNDKTRIAVSRLADQFPNTIARMAAAYGWVEPDRKAHLIDRPASPERGQLLSVLLGGGLYHLEPLNTAGLDLSFAQLTNANLLMMTAQGGMFESADFSGSYLTEVDLGGAWLSNARFRGCVIHRSSFATVTADHLRTPYPPGNAPMTTNAEGVDFTGAAIFETSFAGATMLAANFDHSLLVGADFTGANLGLATFKGAVLLAPDFTAASLKSADFDGAVIIGPDPLATMIAVAEPDSFTAGRFRADPIERAEVLQINIAYLNLTADDIDTITGKAQAWRITRIQPFDD